MVDLCLCGGNDARGNRGCAILAGLALRFVAEFLRELGDGSEEGDNQHAENDSKTLT